MTDKVVHLVTKCPKCDDWWCPMCGEKLEVVEMKVPEEKVIPAKPPKDKK